MPLDLKPSSIYIPEIREKPIKNIGKVAVVIPTKGKIELLRDCIKSFYENCNSKLFDIFIADTGSNDNEKEEIKDSVLPLGNIKLIEYDYYNFAKINNDVVKNHINNDYEFILFSNNDIKLLNNVIYGMLKIFKENKNVGTVGCRLHFEDNTIQHNGVFGQVNQNKVFGVSHIGLKSYYNYNLSVTNVFGNTGGLMMIRKNIFEKCGYFNENYISCFEDVELNMKCSITGLSNYNDGSLVAYHYESVSRNEDSKNIEKLQLDYKNNLLPFVVNNFDKVKNKLIILN